jgi:tRNA pseudouridine38-40 synthase
LSEVNRKFVLVVEYDGTNYAGFQRQRHQPTVQAALEQALHTLTGERIRVSGAGRTDAGVHARGQTISFSSGLDRELSTFTNGLNHYLPPDIAVRDCWVMPASFDVRRDALSREYRYYIVNRRTRPALQRHFAHYVSGSLDVAVMQRTADTLVGSHDFASLASDLARSNVRGTVRRIDRAEVRRHGEQVVITMVGNAFLPHQVRNTAGALIRVGRGKMTPEEFCSIIEAKKPGLGGPAAPACGLFLEKVNYPEIPEG